MVMLHHQPRDAADTTAPAPTTPPPSPSADRIGPQKLLLDPQWVWKIELFFKWIKQNLRIKAFYGTSANAVKTQVWIAVCVYVLVAIVAKAQGMGRNPSEILQILGIMLFEKVPMNQALTTEYENVLETGERNQLSLFDF